MKQIVLFSLLILVSSKNNAIEFAKDIQFDNNNNKFEFTYGKNDSLFIQISCNATLQFSLKTSGTLFGFVVPPPGYGSVNEKYFSENYEIEIKSESKVNGTFWINPSLLDVKIDTNSTVEWKYFTSSHNYKAKLTYVIENAERNVTFIFKYSYNNLDKKNMENPFEICHGNDCQDKITTYDFKEGESYKIYVKHINVTNRFVYYMVFPCFSFYDKTKEKKRKQFLYYSIQYLDHLLFIIIYFLKIKILK